MKKYALLIFMGLLFLNFSKVQAEEFVDKRFYQTFNPFAEASTWMQFTPEKVIEDGTYSYWYPKEENGVEANPVETECELLENKMGYIKYKCPSEWDKNGRIIEVVITDCYDDFYPCALIAYVQDDGSSTYWIPDGSRDDSSYDDSKTYSQHNNNLYKGCPKVFFTRKTKGCDYIRELLSHKKFKYSDLFNPPTQN